MFKYCVWYRVYNKDLINLMKSLSKKFKTYSHLPHLTVQHSLNKQDSFQLFHHMKNFRIPNFVLIGKPYQTVSEDFFAIQQDFIDSSLKGSKVFHISLVYRVGFKFSKKELDLVNELMIPHFIDNKQIKLELWKCDSKFCFNWKKLH